MGINKLVSYAHCNSGQYSRIKDKKYRASKHKVNITHCEKVLSTEPYM